MQILNTKAHPFRSIVQHWLIAIVALLMLSFVVFQGRFLIVGPQIIITESPEGPQNTQYIELKGTAYNISRLWLNDRPIFTDAQGNFDEALVLENGYTVATLRAEDRYGRTTTVSRELVYVPASLTPPEYTP